MATEQRVGVTIDRCAGCLQVWFDLVELDRVLKTQRQLSEAFAVYDIPFRLEIDGPQRRCPRCDQITLLSGSIGDVRAHRCRICGASW